jgi:hypothetical protein
MIVEQAITCMQLVVFHVCNCMQMCFFMYATVFFYDCRTGHNMYTTVFHVCNCMQLCFFMYATVYKLCFMYAVVCNCMQHIQMFMTV